MRVSFRPGGEARALWEDGYAGLLRAAGQLPRRGSHVFAVEEGPHAGRFGVDLSPLGPGYLLCLARTFDRYDEAVAAERSWINDNWINSPEG